MVVDILQPFKYLI